MLKERVPCHCWQHITIRKECVGWVGEGGAESVRKPRRKLKQETGRQWRRCVGWPGPLAEKNRREHGEEVTLQPAVFVFLSFIQVKGRS